MRSLAFAVAGLAIVGSISADASEVGHYSPGVLNIRDFFVPEPGFYGLVYNYAYVSDQLNDRNGDKINDVTIEIPPTTLTVDLALDLDVYVTSPTLIWVSGWRVLGARYAAYASVSFSNTSIGASLTTATGTGRSAEQSQFGVGDPFVQPLWLGWTNAHWDAAGGYGFYAPVGRYSTQSLRLPVVGPITTEAADNIGLGFWTHQLQGAGALYPWVDKRTAIAAALTWEIHGKKQDFDLTPGQNLSLNWGANGFLPLRKDQALLLDLGPAGYDSWQITNDSGEAARQADVRDQVHAAGVQVGLAYAPWNASLEFRYLYEYAATDRFKGRSFGLNLAVGL